MASYRLAGQDFYFPVPIPELEPFAGTNGTALSSVPFVPAALAGNKLISRTEGRVGGAQRVLEAYETLNGILLKVEGSGGFFIASHGETIGKSSPQDELSQLDREIIVGPALVLALALRGIFCLHASAAMYKENVIVFLGESGQGKSTLAAYLSQSSGWRLVADDILPIQMDSNGVSILPHFPQLKLSANTQPGAGLLERLPLKTICALTYAEAQQAPELQKISSAQAVRDLLSHMAGTRMFNASLLAKHLKFSTQAAKQISAYRLIYPHRRDTLPLVREFLESQC